MTGGDRLRLRLRLVTSQTAASKPGPRSFDSADRRIRFQEEQEKNPKCQGRIEWFMSKPDLGGYGEIVPDGGLEAAIRSGAGNLSN